VEKAMKETRDKKATDDDDADDDNDDDDVPGDVLKLFGEDGLNLMERLINNMYETGEWPKDFTEVILIALKKPKVKKCTEHRTYGKDSSEYT
jgi:hypothetical protein